MKRALQWVVCHFCISNSCWDVASAAGPQDQQTQKAAGLTTKLPVLWQWTGPNFENCKQTLKYSDPKGVLIQQAFHCITFLDMILIQLHKLCKVLNEPYSSLQSPPAINILAQTWKLVAKHCGCYCLFPIVSSKGIQPLVGISTGPD